MKSRTDGEVKNEVDVNLVEQDQTTTDSRKDNETDVSSSSPLSERYDVRLTLETTVTHKYHGKSLMSIRHN